MRIVDDHTRAAANTPHNIAHFVKTDFFKAQFAHFCADALANFFELALHAGNSNNIPHELDDVFPAFFNFIMKLLDKIFIRHDNFLIFVLDVDWWERQLSDNYHSITKASCLTTTFN